MSTDRRNYHRIEKKAAILKALAHPTRLMMVDELSRGERCVCELTGMAGVDTSTVSRHLAILKNAGVVVDEKRGQMVFYSLAMPCALTFLHCLDEVLQERARQALELAG